jgi:hypothetical protein
MKESKEIYRKTAEKLFATLVTSISLLTYLVEVRPFINSILGIYYVGLLDGIVATIILLALIFYLFSYKKQSPVKRAEMTNL